MRKSIQLVVFLLTTIFSNGQTADSVTVNGKLVWDVANTVDYPITLNIINAKNNLSIKDVIVDSSGTFNTSLPKGHYILKSSKSYHWQGEDIVRIDIKKSQQLFKVIAENPKDTIVLKFKTVERPNLISEKGILHDFSINSYDDINAFMNAYMSYYLVPGATLAIIKKGEIVFQNNYGIKNAQTNEAVSAQTLFEAGSITKTVLAFITMRLYEKGILDLDKPLYQYKEFEDINHDDRYKKITARIVLSHQTGFPNWARGKFDLKFEPGTKFGYSGEAFEYLKRVLEKITKKPMSKLINEEFITPLGLKNIYFTGSEFPMELLANGHKNETVSPKRNIKAPMMAYSMITNAQALAKFAIALRNREGLKQETYDQLFKIQSTREDGTHWGSGFRIEDSKFGRTYGHSGSTNPGFIGNYVYYDELDMGYIILTNSQLGGWLSLPSILDHRQEWDLGLISVFLALEDNSILNKREMILLIHLLYFKMEKDQFIDDSPDQKYTIK